MDLRSWIVSDFASVADRLRQQVLSRIPVARRAERPDATSPSATWILWHLLRHQDVAVHTVVRGSDEVLAGGGWAARVGAASFAPGTGLSESDDAAAAAALDPAAVEAYAEALWAAIGGWLADADLAQLERVPDAAARLHAAGVGDDAYPWLHRMWTGRPVAFHVQWETIGHAYNHLGELVALRNRLGLGGF